MPLRLPSYLAHAPFGRQLSLALIFGLLFLALFSALAISWWGGRSLRDNFVQQGLQIARAFAEQGTLSLLYDSADNGKQAATATLAFPDVKYVEIRNGLNKKILSLGDGAAFADLGAPASDALARREGLERESADAWLFLAPVFAHKEAKDKEESPFVVESAAPEFLGYVRVAVGKDTLERMMIRAFAANGIISLLFAAVMLGLLQFLTRRLTRPLGEVSAVMRMAEQGQSKPRAPVAGPEEVVRMAQGFNAMIEVLEERESELRASDARHRSVVAALAEGIVVLDAAGRVESCNLAAERILGVGTSQLLAGAPAQQKWRYLSADRQPLAPEEVRALFGLNDCRSRRGLVLGVEKPGRAPIWLSLNCEPIATPDASRAAATVVSFSDITERLVAEEQLRKLWLSVEQSPHSIIITDLDTRIEYVNDAFLQLTGYGRDEVLGRTPAFLKSGQTPAQTYDDLWAALTEGRNWKGEFLNRRKDGELFVELARISPVRQVDGRITHYLAIKEDVTERKRVAAELEGYRHNLEELVAQRTRQLQEANVVLSERSAEIADLYNRAPCGYHSVDEAGAYVAINDTELAWLGYGRDEIVGRMRIEQLVAPHCLDGFASEFSKFKRTGIMQDVEVDMLCKDGTILPTLHSATVLRDAQGRYIASRTTVFDNRERIARQRQLEELHGELRRRAEEAEAATRAKSAFLANVSHEIRTPMNAIIGLTHLLRRVNREPGDQDKLGKIADAAGHLLRIINDVLDVSKIEAGKVALEAADFGLERVLREACALMAEKASAKGIDLTLQIDPTVPRLVVGDPTRLSQALLNYLSNAVKFTERGSIVLAARRVPGRDARVVIRFEVRDTGIGIAPDALERLFQDFEQADTSTTRRFGGTGLGLAINRRLAHIMGGEVGVESRLGHGSTFWFTASFGESTLSVEPPPVSPRHEHVGVMEAEQRLGRDHGGSRVLLAEDNAVNQQVAEELLRGAGLQLDVAENGSMAVAMAQRTDYDLILMDVQMPVLDGLAATRAIRQLPGRERTPILALTANAFEEDRLKCLAAGMNDRISKPVDPEQLFGALLKWLPGRHGDAAPVAVVAPLGGAGPDSPGSCEQLHGIPGLDVAAGLKYLGGRQPMYLRLLRQFALERGADIERLREQLASGDITSARRLAHTLKGVSGTLGARHIQQLSAAIEDGLAAQGDRPDVELMCDELAGDLATLSAAILDRLRGQHDALA